MAYLIKTDEWLKAPNMVSKRAEHSSTCLGDRLYVFGQYASIEILDAATFLTSPSNDV